MNEQNYVQTGIPALDAMLGGKGIPSGSIVLLRGDAGTGKSTLALQIVNNYLTTCAEQCRLNNHSWWQRLWRRGRVALLSLETDPTEAIQHAARDYGFRRLENIQDSADPEADFRVSNIQSVFHKISSRHIDRMASILKFVYALSLLMSFLLPFAVLYGAHVAQDDTSAESRAGEAAAPLLELSAADAIPALILIFFSLVVFLAGRRVLISFVVLLLKFWLFLPYLLIPVAGLVFAVAFAFWGADVRDVSYTPYLGVPQTAGVQATKGVLLPARRPGPLPESLMRAARGGNPKVAGWELFRNVARNGMQNAAAPMSLLSAQPIVFLVLLVLLQVFHAPTERILAVLIPRPDKFERWRNRIQIAYTVLLAFVLVRAALTYDLSAHPMVNGFLLLLILALLGSFRRLVAFARFRFWSVQSFYVVIATITILYVLAYLIASAGQVFGEMFDAKPSIEVKAHLWHLIPPIIVEHLLIFTYVFVKLMVLWLGSSLLLFCTVPWPSREFGKYSKDPIQNASEPITPPTVGDRVRELYPKAAPRLIVVDSLNVLVLALASAFRVLKTTEPDIRRTISDISGSIRGRFRDAVIIFTGESHRTPGNLSTIISESFLCDIEILLSTEPVTGESHRDLGLPVRFDVELAVSDESNKKDVVELRSFCRVLKSRGTPNQSRRCLYDIVAGYGLKFYERYPGDGKVLLFAENAQQEEDWDEFFTKVSPHLHPALRWERFGRNALQRTFADQRGLRNMPTRVDMYLASFDSYWMKWYRDLSQRADLAEQVRRAGTSPVIENKSLSKLLSELHFELNELERKIWRSHPDEYEIEDLRNRAYLIETSPRPSRFSEHHKRILQILKTIIVDEEDARRTFHLLLNRWSRPRTHSGLLKRIDEETLRLFGERRSKLIDTLHADSVYDNGKHMMLSVPYNANVSFFVVNKSLQDEIIKKLKATRAPKQEFVKRLEAVYEQYHGVNSNRGKVGSGIGKSVKKAILERADRFVGDNYIPETWEEMLLLCNAFPERGRGKKLQHAFVAETQTFDSYLCLFLELLWGSGWDLCTNEKYQLFDPSHEHEESRPINSDDTALVKDRLSKTLHRLKRLFELNILARDSSVSREYTDTRIGDNWLYMRHWHSTFVEWLTPTKQFDPTSSETAPDNANAASRRSQAKDIDFDVIPIPVFLDYYAAQSRKKITSDTGSNDSRVLCKHHASWGEWHFGVVYDSENTELAADIINDLMSSQKIRDRALRGAGLPTVKEFYTRYGQSAVFDECLGVRGKTLSLLTYNQLVAEFFNDAKQRGTLFDYRHCMLEIHALIESVRTHVVARDYSIPREVERAVERIEELSGMSTLQN